MRTGVDVLRGDRFDLIRGQRVGLATNQSGLDSRGRSTIDLLHAAPNVELVALFSPEHGIRGEVDAGEPVDSSIDARTGLPVYSLYGETSQPTPQMLEGLDALLFDLQDVGARVYTYAATLLEMLRAAAGRQLRVVILDRPNPINGIDVEGNVLDPRFASFVGPGRLAMRHGLTIGELARFFNTELKIGAPLTVVPLEGWNRQDWYDQTGLPWVNPSPNIRSLAAATLYPGTVLVEGTSLSEGRGTDHPFELIGAPWIDGTAWAEALERLEIPGVHLEPAHFTPTSSKFAGLACQGVHLRPINRSLVQPMALGIALLATARSLAPGQLRFRPGIFDSLAGTDRVRLALQHGEAADTIVSGWETELAEFQALRPAYLLY